MIEQLAVAAIISLGPTLVGLATWKGIKSNASQESLNKVEADVLELHGCLNRHTIQDEDNFRALDSRLDVASGHAEEVAATLAALTARTATELAQTVSSTADTLAVKVAGDTGATST